MNSHCDLPGRCYPGGKTKDGSVGVVVGSSNELRSGLKMSVIIGDLAPCHVTRNDLVWKIRKAQG